MWCRDFDSEGRHLVRECESFLTGCLVEHLLDLDAEVPPWAWTNLLAHGTVEQLRSPATNIAARWDDDWTAWMQARAYLAGEVLEATRCAGPLRRIQRTTLIPLELRLVSRHVMSPSEWVSTVLSALSAHVAEEHAHSRSR